MQIPLLIIPRYDDVQENYKQLKTKKQFRWYCDENIKIGSKVIVRNDFTKDLFLCEVEQLEENIIFDDIPYKTCFTSKILETVNIGNVKLSLGLMVKIDRCYFDLENAHHNSRRDLLLSKLSPVSQIYKYLEYADSSEGCIAVKNKGHWGFLYYTHNNNDTYTFRFEYFNNIHDDKKLTQTDDGYRDFTYFFRSESLPKAYKIGRSDNPDKRLKQLHRANPRGIICLAILPDGRLEKIYHNQFAKWKIHGQEEWFEMADELTNFIKTISSKTKFIESRWKKQNASILTQGEKTK